MRFAGLFVLLAGFSLTVSALMLLPTAGRRAAFIGCGLAVEALGLAVVVRAHMESRS